MPDKIITGGQSGADQAAWRAARRFGIATGGWMPKGFLTEDGPRPQFAQEFGAAEMPTTVVLARTRRNALESDATVWFGITATSGAHDTVQACREFGKPCMLVSPEAEFEPSHVADWIAQQRIRMLNVAGNRESDEPGIGDRVACFLAAVFEQLGHKPA